MPTSAGPFPIYELTQEALSTDFVDQARSQAIPNAQPQKQADAAFMMSVPKPGLVLYVEGGLTRSWVDGRTGDTKLFPAPASLVEMKPNELDAALKSSVKALAQLNLDGSTMQDEALHIDAGPAHTLFSLDANKPSLGATAVNPTIPVPRLVYRRAQRKVGDFRVEGPGSRALVAIGSGDTIQAISRVWRHAQKLPDLVEVPDSSAVLAAIREQVEQYKVLGAVVVSGIEIVYYDSNQRYIQPAYRFTVTVNRPPNPVPLPLVGYVAFDKKWEDIPKLPIAQSLPLPLPDQRKQRAAAMAVSPPSSSGVAPIRVGTYVAQPRSVDQGDPSFGMFTSSAKSFLDGLAGGSRTFTSTTHPPSTAQLLTDGIASGSTDLILVEAHGAPGLVNMLGPFDDSLQFSSANFNNPSPAPAAPPALDIILHSCEVISSPNNDPNWASGWWNLFANTRSVVGYRTIAYYTDNAMSSYAEELKKGTPMLSSWIQEIASLSAYKDLPVAANPPGRPAALSLCTNTNDSIDNPPPRDTAHCLTIWWLDDPSPPPTNG